MTASAYWMVSYEAAGISLFLMLYERKAIMPEEITIQCKRWTLITKKQCGPHSKDLNLKKMASKNIEGKFRSPKNTLIGKKNKECIALITKNNQYFKWDSFCFLQVWHNPGLMLLVVYLIGLLLYILPNQHMELDLSIVLKCF